MLGRDVAYHVSTAAKTLPEEQQSIVWFYVTWKLRAIARTLNVCTASAPLGKIHVTVIFLYETGEPYVIGAGVNCLVIPFKVVHLFAQ